MKLQIKTVIFKVYLTHSSWSNIGVSIFLDENFWSVNGSTERMLKA